MTIPLWVLLGFAIWSLLTLFATAGVYRWTRILTGRVPIAAWRWSSTSKPRERSASTSPRCWMPAPTKVID